MRAELPITMKRPLELKIALGTLACEYLVVLAGYISALLAKISADTVNASIVGAFMGFLIIRPLVLYLLWRGTSWVRTWIVWSLPISMVVFFLIGLRSASSPAQSSGGSLGGSSGGNLMGGYEALRTGHLGTTIALAIGFLAFLALYSPRVGA